MAKGDESMSKKILTIVFSIIALTGGLIAQSRYQERSANPVSMKTTKAPKPIRW